MGMPLHLPLRGMGGSLTSQNHIEHMRLGCHLRVCLQKPCGVHYESAAQRGPQNCLRLLIILTERAQKKSIHHHRGTPLFSVCRPTPRSQSKKESYGVHHFPGKTREKGIHHRSGKKGIHHRASDPEKEKKEGPHGGGVYSFSSLLRELSMKEILPKDVLS